VLEHLHLEELLPEPHRLEDHLLEGLQELRHLEGRQPLVEVLRLVVLLRELHRLEGRLPEDRLMEGHHLGDHLLGDRRLEGQLGDLKVDQH
jgi:hypothetical protein